MKLFVWDFHGVLEKGNESAVEEITNGTLSKFGYKRRMSTEECYRLYGKKWFEFFQYLLPEENIRVWMRLQDESVTMGLDNPEIIARSIAINDYAHEVLAKIKEKHQQILISNSQPKSLAMFLEVTGVNVYFKKRGVMAVSAHKIDKVRSKREVLQEFLKEKTFEQVVTIGDSPADMELGNVRYLYAHPGRKHRDVDADYKIHDLREVLREV